MKRGIFLSVLVFACLVGVSHADLVTNGSFETPNSGFSSPPSGSFTTLSSGSNAILGWTVSSGSIDWINGYWQASNGTKSIDLDGNSQGGIQIATSLATVAGQAYTLSFDMAGNPDGPPAIKNLTVTVGANAYNFTFDTTGKTHSNMGWTNHTFTFLAASSATSLNFASGTSGSYGAAIDNVSVAPVPEPATITLMAAGALGLLRRRRRA